MKQLTYQSATFYLGDKVAEALMDYVTALVRHGRSDAVTVRARTTTGDEIHATFSVGAGIAVLLQSTQARMPEPDNDTAGRALGERLEHLITGRTAAPFPPGHPFLELNFDEEPAGPATAS